MKKLLRKVICMAIAGIVACIGCACGKSADSKVTEVTGTDIADYVNLYGRDYYDGEREAYVFYNSASGFEIRFRGTSLTADWLCASVSGYAKYQVSVLIDGAEEGDWTTVGEIRRSCVLAENLSEGEHTVKVLKRHSSYYSFICLYGLSTDGEILSPPAPPKYKLDIYGDSITCGEGAMRTVDDGEAIGGYTAETQDALAAYACVAANKIDAEARIFGRGGIAMYYSPHDYCVYENYRSIAVDIEIPYDYSSYSPDAVVIYLGTNDYNYGTKLGSRGYTSAGLKSYFKAFIREAIGENYGCDIPIVLLYGMMVPTSDLGEIMTAVAEELKGEFPNISVLGLEATPYGHPVASEHAVAGELLAQRLVEVLEA